ncbi:MAG: prephenate dehydratase [Gemmataceae bacterium]|nr:prephenate dehydratase [Gemmataceae bacterium]MDW8266407.1 prephenate dehydratase [Gemmataceae bacterium]
MTRKTESGSAAAANRAASSLRNLRSQIDKLDLQILKLINERAGVAAEIGRVKNDHGSEIFSPAREEEVLLHVLEANKGPLDNQAVRAIFREIMSGSRALQKVLKVAYLGPEYSYSHLAAVERFGQAVEFIRVGSIAAVFEEVNRSHADFGVVPLENSTDGRVADTLEMFMRLPQLKICAEVRLKIHHNLLANCEQQEIRRVYSKPQALSQCRNWLSKNVPHASLHEVASTATAAELAQREPGAAAVASRQAAVRYGLRILFENIEDYPNNETRFAVIGMHQAERSGHDKTAIMFKVPHHPGSLVDALNIFKQNKLNLTWIESFPARSHKPEYVFFVDFEGHIDDPKVKRTLAALQEQCEELSVLGSFPSSQTCE